MKKVLVSLLALCAASSAGAKPLLTEQVAPVGFLNFEAGLSISNRVDRFGPGTRDYQTVNFPVFARFGVTDKTDLGVTLLHTDQHYDHGGVHLSGASTGDAALQFKYAPLESWGIQGIWHLSQSENHDEILSVAHGNDAELNVLFKAPTPYVDTHLNIGYVWSGNYNSQFGITNGPIHHVKPGNIFQSKLSVEVPLLWHIQGLVESAYYQFDSQKTDGLNIVDSNGNAMDVLLGLTWAYGGWNLGGGVAFGVLDEQHTSFNLTRGAGDTMLQFTMSYKLKPHKPQDQQ